MAGSQPVTANLSIASIHTARNTATVHEGTDLVSNPKEWLAGSMMNLLVDYYPEVQFRPYGSGVRREDLLPVLRDLELGYICIYAKGHGGFTTWPSSLNTRHAMLAQDMPSLFREVTRETGTRLVFYFSGLLDGLAGQRHPDWRMQRPDGSDQQYFDDFRFFTIYANCPHSPFWDEWVSIQLRELIEQYDPDGFWFDGDWPTPCHCPRCQARFRAETNWGGTWSDLQQRDDFGHEYATFWNRVTSGWRARVNGFIKSLKADCAYSAGNVCPRREYIAPFDWRSGDFFSPGFFPLHSIARMMRWYGTMPLPYDAYVCDTSFTHVRKHVRSRSKTLDRMLQESVTVAANGGAVGYWTYPLGDGALVPSRMDKAVTVRRYLKAREQLFLHTSSATRTAILACDPATAVMGDANVLGAHKACAALHRSPDICDETGLTPDMSYDLLVVPEQAAMDEPTASRLLAFTEAGGTLLTSGKSIHSSLLRHALGVTACEEGAVNDGHVLLRSQREPVGIDIAWDRLQHDGAEELYPLYLSWDQLNPQAHLLENNWPMHGQLDERHPEPAGFPAALLRRYGQGCIVHICTSIFANYAILGDPQMLHWLREILQRIQPSPFFDTTAPTWVDVSLRNKADDLLIHFVNQNPGRDLSQLNSDDVWVDEIPPVGPFTVTLRGDFAQMSDATWEPEGIVCMRSSEGDAITIEIPRFHIHGCLRLSIPKSI